jgi:hypothetical protein
MSSSRSFITRVGAPQLNKAALQSQQARTLSSNGQVAVERLREALETYRARHYRQEIPTRFKKEIVKAAKPNHAAEAVCMEGLQRVIANIGAEHQVSRKDVELIFEEMGERGNIPADKLIQML